MIVLIVLSVSSVSIAGCGEAGTTTAIPLDTVNVESNTVLSCPWAKLLSARVAVVVQGAVYNRVFPLVRGWGNEIVNIVGYY